MSEVIGKIIHIGETETVGSAGTFKKRLVVVETSEQYAQKIPVDFVQDKTSMLDKFKIGDSVNVSINIRGNEYNGKYYCSLNGWRISKITDSPSAVDNYQSKAEAPKMPKKEDFDMSSTNYDDSQDLPF